MKNITLLLSIVLLAGSANAAPGIVSGRYVGTAVLTRDDVGCSTQGTCRATIPVSFSLNVRGTVALFTNTKGNRGTLYRQQNGGYTGLLDSLPVRECQLNRYIGVGISRGKYYAQELDQFVCPYGTYSVIYTAYPRKVR